MEYQEKSDQPSETPDFNLTLIEEPYGVVLEDSASFLTMGTNGLATEYPNGPKRWPR